MNKRAHAATSVIVLGLFGFIAAASAYPLLFAILPIALAYFLVFIVVEGW